MLAARSQQQQHAFIALLLVVLCATVLGSQECYVSASEVPSLGTVLTQQFRVSISSNVVGTFNASLQLTETLNFADRLYGELTPLGSLIPAAANGGKTASIPHFKYARAATDSIFSSESALADSPSSPFASALGEPHPPLFYVAVHVQNPSTRRGTVSMYYLPPTAEERSAVLAAINDGDQVKPTVSFAFRLEADPMAPSAMSIAPQLSGISTGAANVHTESEKYLATVAWRLFSEFEFSLNLQRASEGSVDSVRVHAYAKPGAVYNHQDAALRPWYQNWGMMLVAFGVFIMQTLMTFVTQNRRMAKVKAQQAITKAATLPVSNAKSKKKQ